jgi:hypothetical protein
MRGRIGDMKFRKLRMTWSIGWGLAALLLIVLWVRSFRQHDYLFQFNTNLYTGIESNLGIVSFNQLDFRVFPSRKKPIQGWTLAVIPPSAGDTNQQRFQWANMTGLLQVVVPYWVLVLLAATFAVISWICRFSLRTMLVVTTLVAVMLGLVVYAARQ